MPRHHLLRRHPAAPPSSDSPPQPQPQQRQRLNHISAQSQFQTPSPRGAIPFPQLHPSSGAPIDPSVGGNVAAAPEPVRRAAAAQAALFSLFGRGVVGRPQGRESMIDAGDEDEEDYDEDSQFDDEEGDDEGELDGAELQSGVGLDLDGDEVELSEDEMGQMVEGEMDDEGVEEDEDELMQDRDKSPSPLPSDLREISSLASWTVSTHKPGCGVAALRNPDHTQYWQSDGPQPHTLTLHFFKLVAVVKIRVYLDFSLDESYTPTKMMFLAGMGGNDLVEFATWEGEGPCGWVDVPLEGVGGQNGGWVRKGRRRPRARKSIRPQSGRRDKGKGKSAGVLFADDSLLSDHADQRKGSRKDDHHDESYIDGDEDDEDDDDADDDDDPYAGSVLKAMVIQMRIMENHQNGKDTHVRGFQVFARDDDRRRIGNAPSASADGRVRRHSARRSLRGANNDDDGHDNAGDGRGKVMGLEEPDWMGDPVIR